MIKKTCEKCLKPFECEEAQATWKKVCLDCFKAANPKPQQAPTTTSFNEDYNPAFEGMIFNKAVEVWTARKHTVTEDLELIHTQLRTFALKKRKEIRGF